MSRLIKLTSVPHFLRLFLLTLLLSACASTSDNQGGDKVAPPNPFSALTEKPQWYLSQLSQSDAAYRFSWEILTARSLLESGDMQQAMAINQQLTK
ncbi:UNVERIFIED_CONTAM: LppC family lipoprotein, partial [Bacillus mycoides]